MTRITGSTPASSLIRSQAQADSVMARSMILNLLQLKGYSDELGLFGYQNSPAINLLLTTDSHRRPPSLGRMQTLQGGAYLQESGFVEVTAH